MRFIYTKSFITGFTIFMGIGLIIIFDQVGYLGIVKDGFFRVEGSVSGVASAATGNVKEFFRTFLTIKDLVHENAKLQQKINELSFENARLQASKNENIALRRSLNFKESSQLMLMPVEVIGADPTGFSQTIALDKGSNAGVAENSAVVVAPGILVAKVTKVYPNSSEATLITDPSILVNGEVADTAAKGLVRGEHGLGLSFDLISQSEIIKNQDMVTTSGLSGDFPRGILIGQIDSIQSSASDLFQKASISPATDLRNLKFLFVVKQ